MAEGPKGMRGAGRMPAAASHGHTLAAHHAATQWCYWSLVLLGVWLVVAPSSLGYLDEASWVRPSGGRGVWFSAGTHDALRAWLVTGSDVASGTVLLVFGWRSLAPDRPVSLWICCLAGVWLTLAPVVLWAPTAAAYLNDTLVGMLVIALSVLIPGMPNMMAYMQHGEPTPPGWSYNPSSWPQRSIMIAAGFAGFVVSRYLAVFQLGYVDVARDPFFGEGTRRVLDSDMSHGWPISDAALGTLAYTFEFLMGFMGSPARWRTMPWMVTFFGILVIPLGLVHIALVVSQPVLVGSWCTACLLAAAIMLPMIPLEADEVVAMGQHLVQAKRRGDRGASLWAVFWKGGSAEGAEPDQRSPSMVDGARAPKALLAASLWGMSVPWTLAGSAALGVWLMFHPAAFGLPIQTPAADVYHLGGALVATVSVVCMGEPLRAGRYLNVLLGLAVAAVPWWLGEAVPRAALALGGLIGVTVALLAPPRGPKRERYGLWDRYVV